MEIQTILTVFLFCLAALCCFPCLALAIWHRRSLHLMQGQISELTGKIAKVEGQDRHYETAKPGRLTRQDLARRFEQINCRQAHVSSKYRHVARLARSGLDTRELSEVLDVSPMEAEQMLLLSEMAEKAERAA